MFSSIAYAQAATGAAQPGILESFILPMIPILVIFYFLMIRPQSKRLQKHQEFVGGLKRGDEILTTSGIYGRVEGITEKFVTLEVANGVKMRFAKSHVSGKATEAVAEAKP